MKGFSRLKSFQRKVFFVLSLSADFQIIFLLVVRRIKQRKHATTNTIIIIIWPWNIRNTSFSHIWNLLLIFPLFFASLFTAECWSDGQWMRTTIKQHCEFLRRTLNSTWQSKSFAKFLSRESRGTCISWRELTSDETYLLIAQRNPKIINLQQQIALIWCCKRWIYVFYTLFNRLMGHRLSTFSTQQIFH